PARLDARQRTVASARQLIGGERPPWWSVGYVDFVLLLLAALVFWRTAQSGYQIVLAPEGVAAVSVDYWAFLAPFCFWLGMSLLALRLTRLALRHAQPLLARALQPLSGPMTPLVVSALARQPRRIAAGVGLAALAVAFAISTAIFN